MVSATSSEMERYFRALTKGGFSEEHLLADPQKRYQLFGKLRGDFSHMGGRLDRIADRASPILGKAGKIVANLSEGFGELSKISDENFDHYLRTLAMDRLIYSKDQAGDTSGEMLSYLIEGLIHLFFETQDPVLQVAHEALIGVKEAPPPKIFGRKDDAELKSDVEEALSSYEMMEGELKEAKTGLIAHDVQMLNTLKNLRMSMGKDIVKVASLRQTLDKEHEKSTKTAQIALNASTQQQGPSR